jgi:outer membrane protein OmpA-like peptidoglycan-associated protein
VLTSVVLFNASSKSLNAAAKTLLNAFAKKIVSSNSVVVTGYAHGNLALARQRASVVAHYLVGRVQVHVNLKTVTVTSLHEVSLKRQ